MSNEHFCLYEERWGRILTQLENIAGKVCRHVDEGEKEGGFRDRFLIVEKEISIIKKSYWKACLVSGIFGGLIGKLSPDIFNLIIKLAFANK